MSDTKICKRCEEEKPVECFTLMKGKYRRGICYACKTKDMANYRAKNRETTNATAKASHMRARQRRPASFLLYCAKQRATRKNLPFDITVADIIIPATCPVLGIPIVSNAGSSGFADDNSPSLDRVKPELGYVRGNICVISKRANTIKSFGTTEEHEKIVSYMRNHN